MQDLAEAYRNGVTPDLETLRDAVHLLQVGDADAIEAVRGISHRLKGSGTSYGHPEITSLATAVLHGEGPDLKDSVEALVAGLDEVVATGRVVERIAVVDDDPLMRMILMRTLESTGREFVSADSLAEARAKIDSTIDLVLLDLLLPDGDGRELLRNLQTTAATAGIPVVVMSGSDNDQIRRAAIEAGAAAFLEKPFDAAALSDLVSGLLAGGVAPVGAVATGRDLPVTPIESPLSPFNVLVAEDDDLVVALIEDRLSRDGYVVRHHTDGESALADAIASPPDLVILDVMMPKMNGFEVLGRLRASAPTAGLPIIMLTGRGREEDVVHGFDLGATDYIIKPFSPAEVAVRVRRHLASS